MITAFKGMVSQNTDDLMTKSEPGIINEKAFGSVVFTKQKTLLSFLMLSIIFTLFSMNVSASDATMERMITVSGNGKIKVEPDQLRVYLSIETDSRDINAAKQENNQILGRTLELLKRFSIKEKHIQTSRLNIEPRYQRQYQKENFLGYYVTHGLSFLLTDIDKADALVEALLVEGVSRIQSIQFLTSELENLQQESRRLALLEAQQKAKAMVAVYGEKLGKVIDIQENPGMRPTPIMRSRAPMAMMAEAAPVMDAAGISHGEITISTSVEVTFAIGD